MDGEDLIINVKMVYEELSKNMKSFEVVLINIHEWDDRMDEDSF